MTRDLCQLELIYSTSGTRIPRYICQAQRYPGHEIAGALCRCTLCHLFDCLRCCKYDATTVSSPRAVRIDINQM